MRRILTALVVLFCSTTLAKAVEVRAEWELRQLEKGIKAFPNVDWSRYRFLTFGTSERHELIADRKTIKMMVMSVTKTEKKLDELFYEMTPSLFALDIVNLGWSPQAWDDMSKVWTYYQGVKIPQIILDATKTKFPLMRADVFADDVWDSKWYSRFLNLPSTREALYKELGIDNVWPKYAGTISDTLTVTVHPGKVAYFVDKNGRSVYVRMNYENSKGRNDSRRHPTNFDCQYNTISFQLPNGLDAYASYDGETSKLSRFSDTRVEKNVKGHSVELGRSCFECHSGPKKLTNLGDVRELRLDPSWINTFDKKKLQEQVERDQIRWAIALRSAVDMSPAQWDKNVKRLQDRFHEPLTVSRMAKEFGVHEHELQAALERCDDEDVAQLMTNGGAWPRERFEEHFQTIRIALASTKNLRFED